MASQTVIAENTKRSQTKLIRPKPKKPAVEHNTVVEETSDAYCDPELFVKRQIRRTLSLPFYKITKDVIIAQLLRIELAKLVEGRCSVEGYICPTSISISSYSC